MPQKLHTTSEIALRDQFALSALPYMMERIDRSTDGELAQLVEALGVKRREQIAARVAYAIADALMEARVVKPPNTKLSDLSEPKKGNGNE